MTFISRRDLFKRVGVAGAAAVTAPHLMRTLDPAVAGDASALQGAATAVARRPLEHLTASEAELLEAIVARLIPGTPADPGAVEAGAVGYIDRALGGALASSRAAYATGLAAFDRYTRESRGQRFTALPPAEQDSLLTEVETGAAREFPEPSSVFFALVLGHTVQGTFGDPYYGGNVNFVGWDLIGYPGVRTLVAPSEQQRLEKGELPPNHRSAYDDGSFTRASAHLDSHKANTHGD